MVTLNICKNNVLTLVLYLSKLLFKDNYFYYVMSLSYLCPSFLEFFVSLFLAVTYPYDCICVRTS